VRCPHDRRTELRCARDHFVEIGYFTEPQQYAVAHRNVRSHEYAVVVLNIAVVQLKNQDPIGEHRS
jgi:hypothetical protein